MVQAWREPDAGQDAVDLVPTGEVPEGCLHVLDAYDGDDRPVSLVHEDTAALRRMAVFDVVVNNADRKGGHVLAMTDGHRFGVDHGVAFNVEDKLRTVLWGWARRAADRRRRRGVRALLDRLERRRATSARAAGRAARRRRGAATRRRCAALLRRDAMPCRPAAGPPIPWPAF